MMNRNLWMGRLLGVLLWLTALPLGAQGCHYTREDSTLVVRLLAGGHTDPLWYARQLLGRPYVAHTLEGQPEEQLVVNLRQLDCTTLVETVAALTLCAQRGQTTFGDYTTMLRQLRYRGGVLDGYASRLHYFSDWIADNSAMGFVEERQMDEPPFTARQTLQLSYMSRHWQAYPALRSRQADVALIARQEAALSGRQYRYIPKALVKNTAALRRAVHNGDIVAITTSKEGLDIAHLGFAVWRSDGLHLLNASLLHRKVVEEPMTLGQYLDRHASHTGIRIVALRQP